MNMIAVESLLKSLRKRRPIFHSEADLQFALAWELGRAYPEANVRLERPFALDGKPIEVDLAVEIEQKWVVFELKYWTAKFLYRNPVNNEVFSLKQQGARDCRYGFWENVERIERLVQTRQVSEGYVFALSNDPAFWTRSSRSTCDDDFKMNEERVVGGTFRWKPGTKPGYIGDRKSELHLRRSNYTVQWLPYPSNERRGDFRYTAIHVQ